MSEINWQQVLGPLLSSKSPEENDGSNSTEIANRGVISASEVVELDRATGQYSTRAVRLHPTITASDLPFATEPIPWFARGRWLMDPTCRPGAFLNYAAGDYYIQDAGSMLALALCDVQPGQWVCDTCAAPGGKSSGLLEQLRGTGLIVSNEVIRSRLEILELTLARTGHSNFVVANLEVEALAEMCSDAFDCVIVDAPCTGQSMVARGKQSLAAYSAKQIEHSAARQRRILRAACELVKPGGRLVYSTCTFAFDENEAIIDWFRSEHPAWSPVSDSKLAEWASPNREGCYRLWPHRDHCAGAFAAALERPGDSASFDAATPSLSHCNPQTRPVKSRAHQFIATDVSPQEIAWLTSTSTSPIRFWKKGSELHYFASCVPLDWIDSSAKALFAGVPIAELRGGEWQPSYASSVASIPELALTSRYEIDDVQASDYFAGAAIRLTSPLVEPTPGWNALAWHGRCVAWSKFTGGVLKNHLPKALRKPNLTAKT